MQKARQLSTLIAFAKDGKMFYVVYELDDAVRQAEASAYNSQHM